MPTLPECADMNPADPLRAGALPNLDRDAAKLYPTSTGSGLPDYVAPAFVWMTGKLAGWMQYHFGVTTRIEFPALKDRVWSSDPAVSQIWIGSLAEWDPKQSEKRPAILIDRAEQDLDVQHLGIGAGQLQGVRPGYYMHYMTGTHEFNCLGGREGEAEYLAAEVWRELTRYADRVRRWLCLARLLPVRVGRRRQLDQYKEIYTVPVFLSYVYTEAWTSKPADEAEVNAVRSIVSFQ